MSCDFRYYRNASRCFLRKGPSRHSLKKTYGRKAPARMFREQGQRCARWRLALVLEISLQRQFARQKKIDGSETTHWFTLQRLG